MEVQQVSELLGASRPSQLNLDNGVSSALKSVGISSSPDGKALVAAQERMLTAMEESQKAAGHSGALLRAGDLGEAAAKLSGELPPTELRKILADTHGGHWRFEQGPNGTIKAVEGAVGVNGSGMPSMTREAIANRVASTYDQKIGMSVLEETLVDTKNIAQRHGAFDDKHAKAAWEAGEHGAVSEAAKDAVQAGKTSGQLIPEAAVEKAAVDIAEDAAVKAGAKTLGKTLAKSVPLVGIGMVVADVASAAEETYEDVKKGNLRDAGIDGARTVSKAVFGVAGQIASPTIVGGVAINAAGEGADIALQSMKNGTQPNPREQMAETLKQVIHNPAAAREESHQSTLQQHPDLQKAITAYSLIKDGLNQDPAASPMNQQVLARVEANMNKLILEDKLSDIKLPQIIETRTTTQSRGQELTLS